MVRLHLVRHGRAASGWGESDRDPPLDALGRDQAEAVAERLAALGPLPVVSSPLRRCQETAAPLARRWSVEPVIVPAVSEIPTPGHIADAERGPWLRSVMGGSWGDLDADLLAYRGGVCDWVRACATDTVVFSHFVSINAVIGAARRHDAVVSEALDNTSVTVVDVSDDGTIELVLVGSTAPTDVL